ncbi:MAG: DUF4386 family protein [Dehalococcoidia bacterium]
MQSQSDSGMMAQWWRLGGIAGIAWIVVFVVSIVLQGESPSRDDSIEDIRQYFSDDGDMYLVGDWLIGVAFFFFFLPYAVVLSYMVRRDDGMPPILANLVVIGAVTATVFGGVASIPWGALAIGAAENPEVDDSAIRTLMELDTYGFTLSQLPIGLFLAASSLAIWRTGALWRWLGLLGGLAAILLVVGAAWTIDGDEEGGIAILGFIGFPGTLLFILISSVGMIMRKTPPDAPA